MKEVLVTGGAGFIGSHLVDKLLSDDNNVTVIDGHCERVTVIDDLSHGKYANLPRDPRLKVYDMDILGNISPLFEGVDTVFHLAALTRPQWSITHPIETNMVNVDGTLNVLESAKERGVQRLVFMSTSALYGEQCQYPTPEDVEPHPMSPYAVSKLIGEQYCKMYEDLYGLESNYVRPFNAYGSRMPITGIYTSAVATFIDVLKHDKPLEMIGDGNQRRDFVYVDDVVDQLILAATSKVSGEAFNCGSGTNTSINELYRTICNIMDKQQVPTRRPSQFEPSQTLADITKAERLLGWTPKVGLEEGLRRTIYENCG